MQTATELKTRGVKRTKLIRSDGHTSESIESPELTRKMFPPEDGFKVTVVYGYDPDLDGPPRAPRPSPENEYCAQRLGCRWSLCAACRHESCGFCPACNPGGIAPNGEAYDDEDSDIAPCCN